MTELKKGDSFNKSGSDLKGQIISIIVLSLMLITFWQMLDLVLLTFIFTFILYNIVTKLQRHVKRISGKVFSVLVIILFYMLLLMLLTLASIHFIPRIVQQVTELSQYLMAFDFNKLLAALDPRVSSVIVDFDATGYVLNMSLMISGAAAKIGQFSIYLFISLILSFFLVLERDKIKEFGERLESSKISFIYKYFIDFGGVFARTFGKVMKVQVTIAFVNMTISSVCLTLMGFPNIIGLAVMIFFLGLIPVAGVMISMIPLCTIAFTIGGIIKVIEVIVMIIVVHAIEAYILNPKLMANKVRLPVCFVFIILLIGEHYLKVWGLLIGVPIFIFLMTVLDVNYAIDKKKRK